ncbi:hypothetical protein BH23GEM7_BH23GEM7_35300 [soil metagenome]
MDPLTASRCARLAALLAVLSAAGCAAPGTPSPDAMPAPGAPAAAAAAQSQQGAFVTLLGSDTVSVERFTRSGDRIEGQQVVRTPRTSIRDYSATLGADGAISRFEMSVLPAPGAQPSLRTTIDFERDTATVRIVRGDSTQTLRVPAGSGALPFLSYNVALYELSVARLRASGRDSIELAHVPIGATETFPLAVRRLGADSVLIYNIAGANRVRVDAGGRVLDLDGRQSTLKLVAERVATVDLEALAASYAARDQQGQSLGVLSPRDTVRATVGAANLLVDYSRPARRGRTIFGEVVPWNQVWRTGANQATHFRTDREIEMGGTRIPAGTYTLFSLPSPTGWQLIVNRQTGQGGTEYDQSQDLARIDMQRETLPERVEQFTIAIEPQGQGGMLRMMWDDTRASVPFTVR